MTETTTETAGTDTTDAEVAAALGIGDPEEQDQEQEGSEDQESEEQEVGAELKRLRVEIATLRREAAERRVREKNAAAKARSESAGSTDVEAAKEAGREEARAEHGIELTTEAVRAALTGVIPDDALDEFVDELNISRFTTDEHKPDRDAIAALKARQSKLVGATRKTAKVSHGRSGNGQTAKSVQQQFEETVAGLLNHN